MDVYIMNVIISSNRCSSPGSHYHLNHISCTQPNIFAYQFLLAVSKKRQASIQKLTRKRQLESITKCQKKHFGNKFRYSTKKKIREDESRGQMRKS